MQPSRTPSQPRARRIDATSNCTASERSSLRWRKAHVARPICQSTWASTDLRCPRDPVSNEAQLRVPFRLRCPSRRPSFGVLAHPPLPERPSLDTHHGCKRPPNTSPSGSAPLLKSSIHRHSPTWLRFPHHFAESTRLHPAKAGTRTGSSEGSPGTSRRPLQMRPPREALLAGLVSARSRIADFLPGFLAKPCGTRLLGRGATRRGKGGEYEIEAYDGSAHCITLKVNPGIHYHTK